MHPFTYVAVTREGQALSAASAPRAAYLAGGTTLIDLMKLGVETPQRLIDVNRLPLGQVEETPAGLRLGAMVRNSDLAYHPTVRQKFPALSQALLSGASAQLRNMATTGGNLMQRTRCYYFRDGASPCNKREPGSGCAALEGYNRIHAVLGTSDRCIATHPSDMCVALAALDATVHTAGPGDGKGRSIPFDQFYVAYGQDPAKETVLEKGELITAVTVPHTPFAARSHYLKVRDRASYEFALASAAVALELEKGAIKTARVALGGVATKPWRSAEAEKSLVGAKPETAAFQAAADEAMKGAKGYAFNSFKIELAKRTIVRALETAAQLG